MAASTTDSTTASSSPEPLKRTDTELRQQRDPTRKAIDFTNITSSQFEEHIKNMYLKKVTKEPHSKPITQVLANRHINRREHANLIATVGGGTSLVYDNNHYGHMDLLSAFNNIQEDINFFVKQHKKNKEEREKDAQPTPLTAICWINNYNPVPGDGRTDIIHDSLLAAGAEDGIIHIMSVAGSEVINQVHGHSTPITSLDSHINIQNIMLSLAQREKTIKIWRINNSITNKNKIISNPEVELPAESCKFAAFHPTDELVVACTSSSLVLTPFSLKEKSVGRKEVIQIKVTAPIDNFKFVNEDLLLIKANDQILLFSLKDRKVLDEMRVPRGNNPSYIDALVIPQQNEENNHDDDDNNNNNDSSQEAKNLFVCVGNSDCSVYVYRIPIQGPGEHPRQHKYLHKLEPKGEKKDNWAVHACTFTNDCRSIVMVTNNGLVWRYDYVPQSVIEEYENEKKSNGNKDDDKKSSAKKTGRGRKRSSDEDNDEEEEDAEQDEVLPSPDEDSTGVEDEETNGDNSDADFEDDEPRKKKSSNKKRRAHD